MAESCFTYAKSVWTDDLGKSWKGSGSDSNGPALYSSWTGTKSTSLSSSKVPCIVIYTGGANGHTAIVTEYSDGLYHFQDYDGKIADDYDDKWLSADDVTGRFNTRKFKGVLY